MCLFAVKMCSILSCLQHVIPMSYHGRQWCCCVIVRVSHHMSHSVCLDSLCLPHGMTHYIVGVISHDIVFVSSRCN